MDLTRRNVLIGSGGLMTTVLGGAGVWHVYGGNSQKPAENPPPEVEKTRPLAEKFHRQVVRHFPETGVYITPRGEIVMEYRSGAGSKDELRTEFNQIAKLYADVVKEGFEPTTLSIITGRVQAIVPETSLRAYINDEINEKGFLETIEVTDVRRRTDG